jgi:ATP-dependent phosphofructokinase / diphosphate-dependent phosphofructokinase
VRIAISTGGGDAPGLNSVIRAATLAASHRGWEVVGIRDGFNGLMFPEDYGVAGGTIALTRDFVRGIGHLGGTVLGSTNRGNPCAYPMQRPDGSWDTIDRTEELVGLFQAAGVDALITIGGDGSLAIGQRLSESGLRVIGVPKTIDNDLLMTEATFGFDTAVEVATEGIDRLFTTATSHSRIFVVEVMGRYAGWIALNAGMAAGAHAILLPEIPFDLEPVAEMIQARAARGARFAIVVVAEGARPLGGDYSVVGKSVGQAERLGGVGALVAQGVAHDGARPPPSGRDAHRARPPAGHPIRRCRRARSRTRLRRGHGGPRLSRGELRSPQLGGRQPANGPARLRHHTGRARPGRVFRGAAGRRRLSLDVSRRRRYRRRLGRHRGQCRGRP